MFALTINFSKCDADLAEGIIAETFEESICIEETPKQGPGTRVHVTYLTTDAKCGIAGSLSQAHVNNKPCKHDPACRLKS